MANLAYVRVPTIEQNEDRQLEGLKKYNDVRKTRTKKEDGHDFYERWLDKIGYEKSLIIKVD